MTLSKAKKVEQRIKSDKPATFREDFIRDGERRLALLRAPRWPTDRWKFDPLGFCVEVLGVTMALVVPEGVWWMIEACNEIVRCLREGRPVRISIASGHKVGKSFWVACIAIWFYCTFPRARVVMTSTTAHQVKDILWRELRWRVRFSKVKLDSEPGETPSSGLKCPERPEEPGGSREIIGFTSRESEAMAGISGPHVLFCIDEASGVRQAIFDAIEGNRAGGAWGIMTGNPTRNEGEHFESFGRKARFYFSRRVSSELAAKARLPDGSTVQGLATQQWVDEKIEEHGADSAFVKIRIKGQHALEEERKAINLHLIYVAQEEWCEERLELALASDWRLRIGIDVAGEGPEGDEWVFCVVRGDTELEPATVSKGINKSEAVAILLDLIRRHRRPGEKPLVIPDCTGKEGAEFYGLLSAMVNEEVGDPNLFELWRVDAGKPATKWPTQYSTKADELVANLALWLKAGGAIVPDDKRETELHFREWRTVQRGKNLVMKLWPPKDTVRKSPPDGIGRSPDRADALALAVWDPYLAASDAEVKAANVTDPLEALEQTLGGSSGPGVEMLDWCQGGSDAEADWAQR